MSASLNKVYLFDWIVLIAWGMYPLGTYIVAIFSKVPLVGNFSSVLVPIVYTVIVIGSFQRIARMIRLGDLLFYVFVLLLFLFGLMSSVSEWLKPYAVPLFMTALPLYYVGLFVDVERLKKPLYIISILCIITQFLYVFFYEQTKSTTVEELTEERMYTSYQILPHVLLVTWTTIKDFRFLKLLNMNSITGGLVSLLGFMMILSYGARGPLVCYVAFFLFYVLFVVGHFKKRGVRFFIVTFAAIMFLFMDQIILFFYETLESLGVSTRIVELFLRDEFIYSSSTNVRQEIAIATLNDISNNILTGRGMAGDRFAVHGAYCHNFVLEIWASYGVVIGSIMLVTLVVLFVKVFKRGNSFEKTFFLILISAGFIKLFMSGTYIEERYFFFAIGYSLNLVRLHHRTKKLTKKYEIGYVRA